MKIRNLSTTYITPVELDTYKFKTDRYDRLSDYVPSRNNLDYHHKADRSSRSLDPSLGSSQAAARGDSQLRSLFGDYE